MLVLNEQPQIMLFGNNYLNIDEYYTYKLNELHQIEDDLLRRTNFVLEYGVIHEGLLISIIEGLIKFFGKIIDTLLGIFTGGSSSGSSGGGGGGGGGGGSYTPYIPPTKLIEVETYEFKNYTKGTNVNHIKIIVDTFYSEINKAIDSLKDAKNIETAAKDALNSLSVIKLKKIDEFTTDEIDSFIEEYHYEIIRRVLNIGIDPYGDLFKDFDNGKITDLKTGVYESIVGEKKKNKFSDDILKLLPDKKYDKKQIDDGESLIKTFKKDFDKTISELKEIEKKLNTQTGNQKVIKLTMTAVKTLIKCATFLCSGVLIPVIKGVIDAVKLHTKELDKIQKALASS